PAGRLVRAGMRPGRRDPQGRAPAEGERAGDVDEVHRCVGRRRECRHAHLWPVLVERDRIAAVPVALADAITNAAARDLHVAADLHAGPDAAAHLHALAVTDEDALASFSLTRRLTAI